MLMPHSPVRVFLLSDHRLFRESLARVLRHDAGILLVGAEEFSAALVAEIVESTCDVLLVDPVIMALFDAQLLDKPSRCSNLRILKIEMAASIADLISLIVSAASSEDFLAVG
jgi:DNA-binding NarL/FixJ family response regulator